MQHYFNRIGKRVWFWSQYRTQVGLHVNTMYEQAADMII